MGNSGGPGIPIARKQAEYRRMVREFVGEDDLREIVEKMIAEAKGGCMVAAKEILDRMCGKTTQRVEAEVTHDFSEMEQNELVELALQIDAERVEDGLAPIWRGELPAAWLERLEAGGGESSN